LHVPDKSCIKEPALGDWRHGLKNKFLTWMAWRVFVELHFAEIQNFDRQNVDFLGYDI
jgi:hypothetical protein